MSTGTMQNLITLCRRVAETMVPLDRVPVIFSKPHANAPNIHRKTSCWHTFDARDPAWDSQLAEPPADGIRVEGGTDRAARYLPSSGRTASDVIRGFYLSPGAPYHSGTCASRSQEPRRRRRFVWISVGRDAEPLCASDALSYVWPPELGINGAHTITTTGLCMMACDWVAHRLLEYGRADVVSPELMGFVAHMALALSMPENGTLWQKQYETYAKRGIGEVRPWTFADSHRAVAGAVADAATAHPSVRPPARRAGPGAVTRPDKTRQPGAPPVPVHDRLSCSHRVRSERRRSHGMGVVVGKALHCKSFGGF